MDFAEREQVRQARLRAMASRAQAAPERLVGRKRREAPTGRQTGNYEASSRDYEPSSRQLSELKRALESGDPRVHAFAERQLEKLGLSRYERQKKLREAQAGAGQDPVVLHQLTRVVVRSRRGRKRGDRDFGGQGEGLSGPRSAKR